MEYNTDQTGFVGAKQYKPPEGLRFFGFKLFPSVALTEMLLLPFISPIRFLFRDLIPGCRSISNGVCSIWDDINIERGKNV